MDCMSKPICSPGCSPGGREFEHRFPHFDYRRRIVLGSAEQVVPNAVTTTPAGGQTFIAPREGVMYIVLTPTGALATPITYQLVVNGAFVQTQVVATADQSVAFDVWVSREAQVQILQSSTAAETVTYVAPTTAVTLVPFNY